MGLNVLGNVYIGQFEIHASLGSSATGVLLLYFQFTRQICWQSVVAALPASCYTP